MIRMSSLLFILLWIAVQPALQSADGFQHVGHGQVDVLLGGREVRVPQHFRRHGKSKLPRQDRSGFVASECQVSCGL